MLHLVGLFAAGLAVLDFNKGETGNWLIAFDGKK